MPKDSGKCNRRIDRGTVAFTGALQFGDILPHGNNHACQNRACMTI